jgi:anti-sigma factor RsiW
MKAHVSDRLSAYLDGDLDAPARAAVEAHLRECGGCAAELDALRRLVAYARGVAAHDTPPARDLWTGIRARIERLPQAPAAPAARRVSLAVWQLAAAAVLLIAVSAGTAWVLRGGAPAPGAPPPETIEAEIEPTPAPGEVRPVNFADAQYDAAIADLERALAERRNDLNPRTVEILERNLQAIDAAIAQARQALEDDPGNTWLNRHLVESRNRKLQLLRRAAAISEGD